MDNFYISKKQKEQLKPFIPNFEELLKGNLEDFLIEMNYAIVEAMKDDEPTKESRLLERLYDQIFSQNDD